MTQQLIIQKHLAEHGSITSLEAVQKYQIMRLSERIREIEDKGFEIERTEHNSKAGANYPGAVGIYTRYHLKPNGDRFPFLKQTGE